MKPNRPAAIGGRSSRQRDPRLPDQLRAARRARRPDRARTRPRSWRAARLISAAIAAAAPDQVGLEADRRVAPAHRAALDRFEQEAVGPAFGELEHRRDRRLEIGDQRGPDHLRLPGLVAGDELGRIGARRHRARLRTARSGRPAARAAGRRRAVAADHAVDRGAVDLDRIVAPQLGLELRQQVAPHVVLELGREPLDRRRDRRPGRPR